MVGEGGVEFGEGGKTLLRELFDVPVAERGDEFAGGDVFGADAQHVLNFGYGGGRFEADVVAGPHAEQDDVIVIIDQAGDDGASFEVDGLGARVELEISRGADCGESAILDCDLGGDGVLCVEGDDVAVGEAEIAGVGAGVGCEGEGGDGEEGGAEKGAFHCR